MAHTNQNNATQNYDNFSKWIKTKRSDRCSIDQEYRQTLITLLKSVEYVKIFQSQTWWTIDSSRNSRLTYQIIGADILEFAESSYRVVVDYYWVEVKKIKYETTQ